MCLSPTDCGGGKCYGLRCETCFNGKKDPGEADVDCGKTCARRCALGKACSASRDCESGACSQTTGFCVKPGAAAGGGVTPPGSAAGGAVPATPVQMVLAQTSSREASPAVDASALEAALPEEQRPLSPGGRAKEMKI